MEVICNTVVFQEGQLTRLMVDFEKGVWKAFKEQFPSIPIVGCNFHHLQAMRRNLQSIGLVSLYGQDLNFQYAVKLIYALSYVPAGEVASEMQSSRLQGTGKGGILRRLFRRN